MKELDLLEKAASKRVLFCGEKIIDVYKYVRPLGKTMKDPIITVELMDTEEFEGGVIAAAEHAKDFCKSVDIYTAGPVIEKIRYVEQSHLRKLFQCYISTGSNWPMQYDYSNYDCVVVTDYGHRDGRWDTPASKYLAINVQTNAGNYGFNLATKYHKCDYLVVDEAEARLATQNRAGKIEDSLAVLGEIAPKVCITLGRSGAIGACNGEFVQCSAYTESVVDTIGAGDAFFAITALIAEEADMHSLLRIGNAAGAIKTSIVGHRRSVTKDELIKVLRSA